MIDLGEYRSEDYNEISEWSEAVKSAFFAIAKWESEEDEVCNAVSPFAHCCDRAEGHSGPHIAIGGNTLYAVWDELHRSNYKLDVSIENLPKKRANEFLDKFIEMVEFFGAKCAGSFVPSEE